jgi:hypothetical protein
MPIIGGVIGIGIQPGLEDYQKGDKKTWNYGCLTCCC